MTGKRISEMTEDEIRAMSRDAVCRAVAADLIELVARRVATMSPAQRRTRLDPVLMKAALREPPTSPIVGIGT